MKRFEMQSAESAHRAAPVRVRTPGKHIVLFALAVTFMLGLSTTIIRSGRIQIPLYERGAGLESAEGELLAAPINIITDISPDSSGHQPYLKARIKIIARDRAGLNEIAAREPFIRERVTFLLRELAPEDFEGSAGMERVKAEVVRRVNIAVSNDAARDVVFEDLVIQ